MSVSLATYATADDLAAALPANGTFAHAEWTTTMEPRAAFKGSVLTKKSGGRVRFGIDYSKLQANAESTCPCGHAFAGRETGSLPYGVWAVFPRVITHKNGLYVRMYALKGQLDKPVYMVDGVTVDQAAFEDRLPPSKRQAARKPVTLEACPDCGRERVPSLTLTIHAANVTVG